MTDTYSTPDDLGDIRASELGTSLGERLGAQAGEAFMGGLRTLGRIGDYAQAEGRGTPIGPFAHQEYLARRGIETGGLLPENQAPQPPLNTEQEIPIADAAARVKQEGLAGQLKLPDQGAIRPAVLSLMIQDAHERADYNAAVSRGPQGFVPGALGMLTQIGVGMIDPVNDATFAIPVLGEARWGKLLASAGDSILARGGVRALQGGSQGAVGGVAMVPADWWLKTQDGQDYTFADALSSVVMSAGMGAAFHAGFGGFSDARARLRGAPLPGSPEDLVTRGLMAGTHVPAEALAEEGVPEEEIPGIASLAGQPRESGGPVPSQDALVETTGSRVPAPPAPGRQEPIPPHPAEVLADLPSAAREDVTHAAIADVIAGRPVRAAELLAEAAKEDPRIAESIAPPLTLRPAGQAGPGVGERSFEAVDAAGNVRLEAVFDMQGERAELLDVFAPGVKPFDEQSAISARNTVGATQVRNLLRQFRALHPEVKTVTANRISGARHGGGIDYGSETPIAVPLRDGAERVPGPAPGTLRTGRPNVDAVLADPIVADAIANGPVNRANDVPYEAGASNGADPTTNLDRHLPRVAELPSGKSFDPAIPAKIHEQVEKRAMELFFARKKAEVKRELTQAEINKIYEIAHHEYAEPAEDAWYRAQGLDVDEVNAWWAKQDKVTEHENSKNPPPDLYRKPYPHNVVEGVKHEETGAAAEWPTTANVEDNGAADNVVAVRPRRAGGPRARPEATHSLLEHIAANGGLREDDPMIPDVRSSLGRKNHFVPGFGNLIRKPAELSTAAARSGARAPMSLDAARESAVHAGYLEDKGEISGGVSTSTVNDLLEAIDREASGERVYRRGVEPPRTARDEAQHQHELNNAFEKGLSDYGVDLDRIPSKTRDRTLEIMDREGVTDPLDAYERAVMEETQHGAETGDHQRVADEIPGWDLPADAGAAPGAGGAAEAGREPGAGRPARDAGQGDRAAGPDAAARGVADWKSLETPHGPVDDADLAAVSREAEKSPEPASVEPTKAVSAAEAEAAKADQLLADIMPTLSKDERETFEKALAELKTDREAREQIVRDGAACLAAAAA